MLDVSTHLLLGFRPTFSDFFLSLQLQRRGRLIWHWLMRCAWWLQLPTDPRTRVLGLTESNYNVLAGQTATQQADLEYV